jgi:D-alanyl-D-alanine-carboxypeptidase/D-alanyl-D-alanine-endopeptidase
LASTLLLTVIGCAAARASLATSDDIAATVDAYAAAHPHASVIVGVADGSRVLVYTGHGSAAAVPTERSIYQIGSVTKTFTAVLLAQMTLAGEMRLDAPIGAYLPSDDAAPSFEGHPITLLSLAEHNSGLPRLPPNFAPRDPVNPYADYTTDMLYQALSQTQLARAPGTQYEYSNFGVTLLGQLLANRARASYVDLIRARVLAPLGMNDTVVVGTAASRARIVQGFALDGTLARPWDFGSLGGAGSIESDLHDMLIYLQANMRAPAGPLGPAMAIAQQPRYDFLIGAIPQKIGLVWMTNPHSGITWHNGETGGYHSFIGFNRAANYGVVVLSNVADPDTDLLGVHILAPYIKVPW